ncbi:amidohydrolase family protein [Streptosporangium sp. NPDC023825]|uniref:amidohydrolase family protein n=1 Tax=Streptosporangium sp. NPDC023825 TaxID=3154909 RepID=UPI0034128668
MSVVDAHVHVWGAELLGTGWLAEPASGAIRRIFTLDDLAPELATTGVARVVLVAAEESDAGSERLLAGAAHDPRVLGVVAWAELARPDAAERLAALRAAPGGTLLRGVRQSLTAAPAGWWTDPATVAGLIALEREELLLELLISAAQLPEAAALAARHPGLAVVIDHLANAHEPDADPRSWRTALDELARAPRAVAKVSGLGDDEGRAVTLLAAARAALGADRLLWGSDWPVLLLRDDYAGERARVERLLAGWHPAERAAVLGGTAARVYGGAR